MTETDTDWPPARGTPESRLLAMMLGVAGTQLIGLAAHFGIADLLRDGPKPIGTLAEATGTRETGTAPGDARFGGARYLRRAAASPIRQYPIGRPPAVRRPELASWLCCAGVQRDDSSGLGQSPTRRANRRGCPRRCPRNGGLRLSATEPGRCRRIRRSNVLGLRSGGRCFAGCLRLFAVRHAGGRGRWARLSASTKMPKYR